MSEELDGWIAIQRRVFKAGKFKEAPFSEREAWIWLIAKAVFKPTTHRVGSEVYDVPRGSRFYTIRELMSEWKWGNTKVRNYLVFLEKQDMAVTENKSGKTLITVCNYNEYQFDKSQTNQPQITDKPEANQDQITKEQDKQSLEEKTNKKENSFSASRFEEFWEVFDDKRGKANALKVWKSKKMDSVADEVIAGAKAYAKSRGDDRKYWKQAQGWLNGERWNDDLACHQMKKETNDNETYYPGFGYIKCNN